MRIVYDREGLCLNVDPGDPLHVDALETWREADELAKSCIKCFAPEKADAACERLADTATHALTAGRDNRVISDFKQLKRDIRNADETLRAEILNNALMIFVVGIISGAIAGFVWIVILPYAPWNLMFKGPGTLLNYTLMATGWAGFTLVGFSIGWLLLQSAVLRTQDREDVLKQAVSLRQRRAHITYNVLVCFIIVIVMFFFGGFDKINQELSTQLTSAPWAILLGLVAGVAEPALFERIRGFLKLN